MNFSFILPSRGKKDVIKMLDSFERTTKYKDKLEILITFDIGNNAIVEDIKNNNYSFDIRTFHREKTKDFTNDYYNWMANKTRGKIISGFNDDAWMRTLHWDKKILDKVAEYKTDIFCLDVPDTARIKYENSFPCFPMVSRKAFCVLGFLLSPEIRMFPADKVTYAIYTNANAVIKIDNVLIEHEHTMDYSGEKKELMDVFMEDVPKQKNVDISNYIYKIMSEQQHDIKKRNKFRQIINILKEK